MNTPSPNSLRLVSYNCRGWRSGSDYVKLLQSCDLCFIQEHWLFREHLGSLNISNDFLSVGVSGMDSSEILVGRPFGGCGILYRKSLSPVIRRIFISSRPDSNFTTLTSFMSSHKLVCVDKLYNINFTYRKDDFSCFSSPDHILTNSNFSNLIDSVFTLDLVENFSDHLPLHFSLKLPDFLSFSCPRNPSVNSHCHLNHSHA